VRLFVDVNGEVSACASVGAADDRDGAIERAMTALAPETRADDADRQHRRRGHAAGPRAVMSKNSTE
jgi:hypothetical protein